VEFTQGANHPIFVKTDMVCYKRLLCMVWFLRPPATTSGWTTFPAGYTVSLKFKMASKMAAII